MNVLIIGGTGTVGAHVAASLAVRGAGVRVVTRSADKAASLHTPVHGVVADLNRSYTLRDTFEGIDSLILITAHSITETGQGLAALTAALEAGVRRIVYLSAAMGPGSMRIPHVASKVPIENVLITSRLEYTIIRPNNLFQNDLTLGESIVQRGVYPQPFGSAGVSRIDARDVADAIANAVTRNGHERRIYTLGGPEPLTGEGIAAAYAHHLHRPVRYAGDDLDAWEKVASATMPKWQRDDFRIMYRYFQENGLIHSVRDLVEQERVIGHEPRRFDDFVATTAEKWRDAMELEQPETA